MRENLHNGPLPKLPNAYILTHILGTSVRSPVRSAAWYTHYQIVWTLKLNRWNKHFGNSNLVQHLSHGRKCSALDHLTILVTPKKGCFLHFPLDESSKGGKLHSHAPIGALMQYKYVALIGSTNLERSTKKRK